MHLIMGIKAGNAKLVLADKNIVRIAPQHMSVVRAMLISSLVYVHCL